MKNLIKIKGKNISNIQFENNETHSNYETFLDVEGEYIKDIIIRNNTETTYFKDLIQELSYDKKIILKNFLTQPKEKITTGNLTSMFGVGVSTSNLILTHWEKFKDVFLTLLP